MPGVVPQLPSGRVLSEIERRAGQVADPVARLRYLQGAIGKTRQPAASRLSRQPRRLLYGVLAGCGVCLAAWSLGTRLVGAVGNPPFSNKTPTAPRAARLSSATTPPPIWLAETTGDAEVYSNGLRVETRLTLPAGPPRSFRRYRLQPAGQPSEQWEQQPAGIVFHTTESHIVPFEEKQTRALRRARAGLLEHVRQQRSYHYVLDRFGRVHRVVPETEAAYHAGHSVWADGKHAYLNVNDSFLGVAFEASSTGDEPATPAQIRSGRELVDMLRAKYGIPSQNCVTHAQVSVSPVSMAIGYHTDWAREFPFAEMGLGNNYALPPASLVLFGFHYDAHFLRALGLQPWPGLALAEQALQKDAARHQQSVEQHRASLQQRYKTMLAAHRASLEKETQHGLH